MAKEKETKASKYAQSIYKATRKGEIKFGEPEEIKGDKEQIIRWTSAKLKSKAVVQFDVIKKEGQTASGKPKNPRYIINVIDAKKNAHSFSGKFARALETYLTKGETKRRTVEMSEDQTKMVTSALKEIL